MAADLIQFDAEASVIMICRWFKHNPPTSENHLTGIERLPSEGLAKAALQAAQETWDSFRAKKAAKAQGKERPASGLPNGAGGEIVSRLQAPFIAGRR